MCGWDVVLLHIEYQITNLLVSDVTLAALCYFKGLFVGQVMLLRLMLELGLG